MALVYSQNPDKDCYVFSSSPGSNYNNADLEVGEGDVSNGTRKSLIHFDLSSIPVGALIESAVLSMYYYTKDTGSYWSNDSPVIRVSSAWSETSPTWNSYPGDYGSSMGTLSVNNGTAYGWISASLNTNAISELVNGVYPNHGFNLNPGGGNNMIKYGSRSHGVVGYRPILTINYNVGTIFTIPAMAIGI